MIRILSMRIYFGFKADDEDFIVVDKYGVQWGNTQKKGSIPLICGKWCGVSTGMKYPNLPEIIKCLL